MADASPRLKSYRELSGPRGLPLVGNVFQIRLDTLHRTIERWADEYGPCYRMRIGSRRIAVISDPAAIQRIHRERPGRFRRTRSQESAAAEMGLKGVFAAEGDDWLRQRKIVVMALNTAHLKSFFPKLVITVGRLLRRWERAADAGEPVDLSRDLMRLTVDVTTQLAFGVDFNTLETAGPVIQHNLDKVFPMLNLRVNAMVPYWRYVRLPKDRELDRALAEVQAQVKEIVREARARMRADPALYSAPTNFLEAIIAAQEVKGAGFSDGDIFANVCTLLLAGEDTTAHTIGWAVHCFLQHPEHLARARAEVDGVLAPAALVEEMEQAGRLPFLDAFFHEAMRVKPVVPINAFEPLEDVEILGHLIPRGTVLVTLNRHIAMQDEYFGDGVRFDPERWLAGGERPGCPHDTSAFLPFGAGPRFCPGRNLAMLQIRTGLAMLCRNFDVALAYPERPVGERLAFTMMPTNLVVRLKKRTPPAAAPG